MSDDEGPVLRVVSGNASDDDIAVLTAVLAVTGNDDDSAPTVMRGGWNDPARLMRRPLAPGPGAWRSSFR